MSDIEQRDKRGALIGNAPLILKHRFPGVPNLGDITRVDWSQVESVDIFTGGSPCQDVSISGARAGMTEGTRSNLWVAMREAIAQLKPALVIWENVAGALSAKAQSKEDRERDSRVESEPGLLGGVPGGPALRAAGRVCGDLASLGFDAEWTVVRASDVGAPHQRARIFIVAAHPERISRHEWWLAAARETGSGGPLNTTARCDRASVRLLPTPRACDFAATPGAPAANRHCEQGMGSLTEVIGFEHITDQDWGKYAPAIRRWESVIGRPAPALTVLTKGGKPKLSPRFVEWLMGLPAGWVVDVPGLTRNQQLHALGNGVCPQQAAFAIRMLLTRLALQEAS